MEYFLREIMYVFRILNFGDCNFFVICLPAVFLAGCLVLVILVALIEQLIYLNIDGQLQKCLSPGHEGIQLDTVLLLTIS